MNLLRTVLASAVALCAVSTAQAQTRPVVPTYTISENQPVPGPINALSGGVLVQCRNSAGFFTSCNPYGSVAPPPTFVELSQFATFSELSSLSARVDALDNGSFQEALEQRADEGAALAGAIDFVSPADGAANRIGAQAFTIGDRTAVGAAYTRAVGRFDFGVGIAASQNRTAGKIGVGFSW